MRRQVRLSGVETAVFVVIAFVVVVFAYVLGSLKSDGAGDAQVGTLAAELEVERRRVRELEQELERVRAAANR
jgi:hypothetical protein